MPYNLTNAKTDCESVGGICDFQYDQDEDIRCNVGGSHVSSGWCHALVIMWLKKNFASANFLDWFAPPGEACPQRVGKSAAVGPVFNTLKQIMIDQSTTLTNFNRVGNKTWWAVDYALVNSIKKYNITPGREGLRGVEMNLGTTLMVRMISECSGYHYVRFGAPDEGSHAVGVYAAQSENLYVFFDPNFGQYRFPSPTSFSAFLHKLISQTEYCEWFSRMGILHIAAA